MVEKQFEKLSLSEDSGTSEITRDKLPGHKKSVNTIQYISQTSNLPECLLSASDDGTARIWDLRLNKGVVLLHHNQAGAEVACARLNVKQGQSHVVVTACGSNLQFFDIRKPSLILKQLHQQVCSDEINDISISAGDNESQLQVASCDDSGSTLFKRLNYDNLEVLSQKELNTKHSNICFKVLISPQNNQLVYTTGFDYKLCLWNIKDLKKSQSTNLATILQNELGSEAMSYNPPFCYAWDTFESNGAEHIILGLGNGMLMRYKRKGLACQEMHGQVHNYQISSLQVDRCQTVDYLLTASSDKTFGVHVMNIRGKEDEVNINQMTLLKVQLLEKPNQIATNNLQATGSVYLCDVTSEISKFCIRN